MEQQEPFTGIACVEAGDTVARCLKQFCVAGHSRGRRIGEIREEAEEKIRFPVGQEADLELFDFLAHYLQARQHHGHDHKRGVLRRNLLPEIHFGQLVRRQERNHQRVDDLNGELAQRKQRQRAKHD